MSRYTLIAATGLLALAVSLLSLAADNRRSARGAALGTVPSDTRASPWHQGPRVAPVRRVMPVTPPFPEAILLAGDVVEPSRAPDVAPLPARRDAELAAAYVSNAAVTDAAPSMTRTAQDQTAPVTLAE